MEQFPQEMGNQNTPAMSDHVVVKRESLRLILHAARHLTSYLRTEEQEALDDLQDSYEGEPPEMVPMEAVDNLISAIENYREQCPADPDWTTGFYAAGITLDEALESFNAKFKV